MERQDPLKEVENTSDKSEEDTANARKSSEEETVDESSKELLAVKEEDDTHEGEVIESSKATDKISEESDQNAKSELSTGKVESEIGDTQDLETDEGKDQIATDVSLKTEATDLDEKLSQQQKDNLELKLKLNASQQAEASLKLEMIQKEEIIIRIQAEALKKEQACKYEVKKLKEKWRRNSRILETYRKLEEQLNESKARENKAATEVEQLNVDAVYYLKTIEEHENTIAEQCAEYHSLKEDHETTTSELANVQLAFSDVIEKYEESMSALERYKEQDTVLISRQALAATYKQLKELERKYGLVETNTQTHIDKSSEEIVTWRDRYEVGKKELGAVKKRIETKRATLEASLKQKTEECASVSAVCDEIIGEEI